MSEYSDALPSEINSFSFRNQLLIEEHIFMALLKQILTLFSTRSG